VTGTGVPFSKAEAASLAALASPAGPSWSVLGAVGLDERTAGTLSTANLSKVLGANCTASGWNGTVLPSSLTVPVFSGSFASGVSPLWLVFLAATTAPTYAIVEVLNGSAVPVANVQGTGCGVAADQPLPKGALDSPVVAATAWNQDGEGWVQQDPGLTSLTMAAFGGGTYAGVAYSSLWGFVYSPCDPLAGGTVEKSVFIAALGLTTGTVSLAFSYHLDCP
jgi:hypothetical protein